MNVHVFATQGQRVFLENFFQRTLADKWVVVVHELPSGKAFDFATKGFARVILGKISLLIDEIFYAEKDNSAFILSDIDIQFFGECEGVILRALEGFDIAFQKECGGNSSIVNAGFIAMRPSRKVRRFWIRVRTEMMRGFQLGYFTSEQDMANMLLPRCPYIHWTTFPSQIWAWSNKDFAPDRPNFADILLHHANCTASHSGKSSVELKLEQLHLVAAAYSRCFTCQTSGSSS